MALVVLSGKVPVLGSQRNSIFAALTLWFAKAIMFDWRPGGRTSIHVVCMGDPNTRNGHAGRLRFFHLDIRGSFKILLCRPCLVSLWSEACAPHFVHARVLSKIPFDGGSMNLGF